MHGKFQQLSTKPWFSMKIVEQLFPCRESSRLWQYFTVSQNLIVIFKIFPENNGKFLCFCQTARKNSNISETLFQNENFEKVKKWNIRVNRTVQNSEFEWFYEKLQYFFTSISFVSKLLVGGQNAVLSTAHHNKKLTHIWFCFQP